MKKIIAAILSLAMLGTSVSCGKKQTNTEPDVPAVESIQLSFNEAEIDMAEDFGSIYSLTILDGNVFIFGTDKSGNWMGYTTNGEFADYKPFSFTPDEGEDVKYACVGKFGKKAILTKLRDETKLYIYDGKNELVAEKELGQLINNTGAAVIPAGDGYIVNVINEHLYAVSSSGELIGEVKTGDYSILGVSNNSDGVPTVILKSGSDTYTAAIDGAELGEKVKCSGLTNSAISVSPGQGNVTMVGSFYDGIKGLCGDKWLPVTDLMDNSFSVVEVNGIVCTGEDEYVVSVPSAQGYRLVMLTKNAAANLKSKKVVTIGALEGRRHDLEEIIKKYNQSHPDGDYRVEFVGYPNYTEGMEPDGEYDSIKLDIATGKGPDIVAMSIPGIDPSAIYMNLMDYLEVDPDLNAKDFIPGLLDALKFRGSVTRISPFFGFDTLPAKTKFVGDNEGWSYDDFINAYENLPEGMKFYMDETGDVMIKETVFTKMVTLGHFLDFDKATCNFDSPEFIRLLEFFKNGDFGMTVEEYQQWWNSMVNVVQYDTRDPFLFTDDKCLLGYQFGRFESPEQMVRVLHGEFNEPVTFVGFPSFDGCGGRFYLCGTDNYSIVKNAKNPDGAWDFIKYTFSDEVQEGRLYSWGGFSVLEEKFVEQLDETTHLTFMNAEEKEQEGGFLYYRDVDGEYKDIFYDSLTEEEKDRCMEYIRNIIRNTKDGGASDQTIYRYINMEIDDYFSDDSKTAQQTAEMLQNRISIYLSEKYG